MSWYPPISGYCSEKTNCTGYCYRSDEYPFPVSCFTMTQYRFCGETSAFWLCALAAAIINPVLHFILIVFTPIKKGIFSTSINTIQLFLLYLTLVYTMCTIDEVDFYSSLTCALIFGAFFLACLMLYFISLCSLSENAFLDPSDALHVYSLMKAQPIPFRVIQTKISTLKETAPPLKIVRKIPHYPCSQFFYASDNYNFTLTVDYKSWEDESEDTIIPEKGTLFFMYRIEANFTDTLGMLLNEKIQEDKYVASLVQGGLTKIDMFPELKKIDVSAGLGGVGCMHMFTSCIIGKFLYHLLGCLGMQIILEVIWALLLKPVNVVIAKKFGLRGELKNECKEDPTTVQSTSVLIMRVDTMHQDLVGGDQVVATP